MNFNKFTKNKILFEILVQKFQIKMGNISSCCKAKEYNPKIHYNEEGFEIERLYSKIVSMGKNRYTITVEGMCRFYTENPKFGKRVYIWMACHNPIYHDNVRIAHEKFLEKCKYIKLEDPHEVHEEHIRTDIEQYDG